MQSKINKYILDGGSEVDVHKVFGQQYYFAIVNLKGIYPKKGFVARNKNRREYITLIEGSVKLQINETSQKMIPGSGYLVKNKDTYFLNGTGKLIVFVDDGRKLTGKTEILQT